ncbi:MAG TPA: PaaI family thioesterase [Acidimicrobiia bacterium]|nr:PaaI family thioesterase [Acidimicrobiia bacterium]
MTSAARLDASAAARELVHALVAADADDATFTRTAAIVRDALAQLEHAPRLERTVPDFAAGGAPHDPTGPDPMSDRAVAGSANPTAVRLETRRDGADAVADVWFGPAFVGAPGRVHGGMVAAVFDDITGWILRDVREPGFTGRLEVSYRAPVPIEALVEFRARMRSREGRKMVVEAEARIEDRVLATAEALFILVDAEHFATDAGELLARPARDRHGGP